MNNLMTLIFFLLLAFSSWTQDVFAGNKYLTDVLVGDDFPKANSSPKKIDLSSKYEPWGNFLQFNMDGTFTSFNQDKCGNSCRKKISGTYILQNGEIELFIKTIRYYDICASTPSKNIDQSLGKFKVIEEAGGFLLEKL